MDIEEVISRSQAASLALVVSEWLNGLDLERLDNGLHI
jgi:hypothetical protein